jgi:ribosome assembly protein RRB1
LKHKEDKFPMTVYYVAGSQAATKSENKIYCLKWSDMHKTLDEDESCSDEEDENEKQMREPTIRFEGVPHKGAVNRIRSLHGSGIVATWNDEAEVAIYNVSQAIDCLDKTSEPVPSINPENPN